MRQARFMTAAFALLLVGCSKQQPVACDSPDAQTALSGTISNGIAKYVEGIISDNKSAIRKMGPNIRATISQFKFEIRDIRTSKTDPNSTKIFCEGELKIVIPLNVIKDADEANRLMDLSSATEAMGEAGFEREADSFTQSVAFTLQPTDDGKKIFTEIEEIEGGIAALAQMVLSHIVLPRVKEHGANSSADYVPSDPEARPDAENDSDEDSTMLPDGSQTPAARVRAFYTALRYGNGAVASDLIVSEKRNLPAFLPSELSKFYGNLVEPIELINLEEKGDASFLAHYRYRSGSRVCNGYANISVVNRSGKFYIQNISALSGC